MDQMPDLVLVMVLVFVDPLVVISVLEDQVVSIVIEIVVV